MFCIAIVSPSFGILWFIPVTGICSVNSSHIWQFHYHSYYKVTLQVLSTRLWLFFNYITELICFPFAYWWILLLTRNICSVASSKLRESLQDKPCKLIGIAGKTNVDPAHIVHFTACVPGTYQFIPLIRMANSQ